MIAATQSHRATCSMYAPHHHIGRRAALILLLLGLLPVFFSEPGGGAEAWNEPPVWPSKRPSADRTLKLAMFDRTSGKWAVTDLPYSERSTHLVRFGEEPLWVSYGVKEVATKTRSGAISVKVSRFFPGLDLEFSKSTLLTRGRGFFKRARFVDTPGREAPPLPDAKVARDAYRQFHGDDEKVHPFLHNTFHAFWAREAETDTLEPDWRRRLFLFRRLAALESEKSVLERSYLFRYVTTSLGSWVPFSIGTGNRNASKLNKIEIIVSDLALNQDQAEVSRTLARAP